MSNVFSGWGQQAYVGYSSSTPGANTLLWRPLNYTPDTNRLPVVRFSTYMAIVDSTNSRYDDFGWDVYNHNGQELFFLDFDNNRMEVYYLLNDGAGYHDTGVSFQNDQIYHLVVIMDFAQNRWEATLNGLSLVQGQPISATNNVPLDLADIDATWLQTSGTFGENLMLFDDYYVAAQPSQQPRITTAPQAQSVTVGDTATFLVVVDSPLSVAYQWQLNGTAIPGATAPTLPLQNVAFNQAGSYSVIVSNSAGIALSVPAALVVRDLPNLVPYRPTGWSSRLVAATVPGSTLDASAIHSDQDVYISWAVLNRSTNGAITARFYTQLYLDGTLNHVWHATGLSAGHYIYVTNYDLGQLSPGTHTLRLDTDTTQVVTESNENDNSYSKSINVIASTNAPFRLLSPLRTPNGPFQFTLQGTAGQIFEIQSSTDLVTWSALATLTDSIANGTMPFVDLNATNWHQRFYRARLPNP